MLTEDWLCYLWWVVKLLPVIILVVIVPLIFAAAMWEKHRTRAYGPPETRGADEPEIGPYLEAMMQAAEEEGLGPPTLHRHLLYDITAAFWFDAERQIMIQSGQGRIFKIPIKQTWLYSRLSDGKVLVTTDQFDEGDRSGLYGFNRVLNTDLVELLRVHRRELARSGAQPEPFREQTGADVKWALERERGDSLVRAGSAHWVDEVEGIWRYTFRGACGVLVSYVKQIGIGIMQFWRVK